VMEMVPCIHESMESRVMSEKQQTHKQLVSFIDFFNLRLIGIAKNFLAIPEDGLELRSVKLELKKRLDLPGSSFILTGTSGYQYGAALRSSHPGSVNPVFVSPGYHISLSLSLKLTKLIVSHP
jgi:deoxyinosine 3'endonuclease (endonuclease V)